jgi:hypothetical protein
MFALNGQDLDSTILGCADGPASFNAHATRRGSRVVSCDPIYAFDTSQIEARIRETFEQVIEQTRQNADEFVWGGEIPTVEALGSVRMAAMRTFLDDYATGKRQERYVAGALPALPFGAGVFDLALCSHFLFLYSDQFGEAFHHHAILEMCRVAAEVRIFPIVALGGARSALVDPCVTRLGEIGYQVTVETVAYEFQRGGNQMMRIRSRGRRGTRG